MDSDFRTGHSEDGLSAPQLRLRQGMAAWVEPELGGIDAETGDEAAVTVFRRLARRGGFSAMRRRVGSAAYAAGSRSGTCA